MKKGKAAKKAAIAVVTAVAVGGVSVGGYYGIRQAQKTTVKVYPDRWVHLENPGNPGNPAPPDSAAYPIPVLSFSAFPGSRKRAMW